MQRRRLAAALTAGVFSKSEVEQAKHFITAFEPDTVHQGIYCSQSLEDIGHDLHQIAFGGELNVNGKCTLQQSLYRMKNLRHPIYAMVLDHVQVCAKVVDRAEGALSESKKNEAENAAFNIYIYICNCCHSTGRILPASRWQ